jgi:hypothetical protein
MLPTLSILLRLQLARIMELPNTVRMARTTMNHKKM